MSGIYYRLSVIPLNAPPLRERKDDIELLATHFISQACKRLNKITKKLTESNLRKLQSYNWPGNIREMQNVIERTVILATEEHLNVGFSIPNASEYPTALTPSIFSE